jgi:hypothetical protein
VLLRACGCSTHIRYIPYIKVGTVYPPRQTSSKQATPTPLRTNCVVYLSACFTSPHHDDTTTIITTTTTHRIPFCTLSAPDDHDDT